MTTTQQTQKKKTNYEIFIETVNSLKYSQGFYSRLARNLEEMDRDTKVSLEQTLNNLPQWNDQLDCVLYLEQ